MNDRNKVQEVNANESAITKPIKIWLSIIVIGFIVKVLHLLSSVFIVIGFAGLTAYVLKEMILMKNRNLLFIILLVISILFLLIILIGILFNNGYPINLTGLIIYFIIFPISFGYYASKKIGIMTIKS